VTAVPTQPLAHKLLVAAFALLLRQQEHAGTSLNLPSQNSIELGAHVWM
jgi:hypothetical protein